MDTTRIFRRAILPALLIACLGTLACSSKKAAEAPPDGMYSVRGEIAQLPSATSTELLIHHEAIPDFVDPQGARTGMESMTMPFPLAPGVDASGLAVGDRIAFDFEVRWKGPGRPLAITRLERLPAGTRLEFDAEPASEGDAAQGAEPPAAAEPSR